MSLDLDLEKLFEDFFSNEESTNSNLAYLLYKHMPHNDSVDALDKFSKVSEKIEHDFNSDIKTNNITTSLDKELLLSSIIEKYAEEEGWYLMYAEDLSEEIEVIVNEYFKNGNQNEE
jgi:hypothetical protein